MSKKIIERRNASVNVPEKDRAEMANSEQKKKRSAVRGILVAVVAIILIAALLLVVVNVLVNNIAKQLSPDGSYKNVSVVLQNSYKDGKKIYSDSVQNSEEFLKYAFAASNNHSATVNNIKDNENVFNYAIYGIENSDANNPSADTIVIASINKTTNELTYVHVNTEMLVYIPYANEIGYLKDAYNFGNANLLSRTISQNLGVDIDGYVELKLEDAVDIVDAVNGIDIAMSTEEIKALNDSIKAYNERFDKSVPELNEELSVVNLRGDQALAYIRGTSANREQAIFTVLTEATKRAIQGGVDEMEKFLNAVIDDSNTVVSTEQEDFATLLMLLAKTAGDTVGDSQIKKLDLGATYEEAIVLKSGVKFVSYDDYSVVVKELQNALYSAK